MAVIISEDVYDDLLVSTQLGPSTRIGQFQHQGLCILGYVVLQ